jgi:hypothetical protein
MRDLGLVLVVALTIGSVPALRANRIVLHVDHEAAPAGTVQLDSHFAKCKRR